MHQETNTPEMVSITAEELRDFQALKAKREAEEKQKLAHEERQAYREMAMKLVDEYFPKVKEMNEALARGKQEVYEAFASIIDAKTELLAGTMREGQRSHTFTNATSTARIIIGRHKRDAWDSTVEIGIAKVKQYVSSLVKDEATETLVSMILDLLAKDQQGNLKADKVLQLSQYASESDSPVFKEGVSIIQEAYCPELTKLFIRAEERNEQGKWVNIPLNITEA